MLYRIHTESMGPYRRRALEIVATTFDGFTVTDCEGYWKGNREESIDTGLAWTLQGHYGRAATALIESGVCHV